MMIRSTIYVLLIGGLATPLSADPRAEDLTQKGEEVVSAACAHIMTEAQNNPERASGLWHALMRCHLQEKHRLGAERFARKVLYDPFWHPEALALISALKVLQESDDSKASLAEYLANKEGPSLFTFVPHPSDLARREALAQLLAFIVQHGDQGLKEMALKKLYVEVPDTAAAQTVFGRAKVQWFKKHVDPDLALARAEVLTRRHKNKMVFQTLKPHLFKMGKNISPERCRMHYLAGKAARKMRRYKTARRHLDQVADLCHDEHRMNAHYMAARVASMSSPKSAIRIFDRFLANYPQHGFTDDVLLWKALTLEHGGRTKKAIDVYGQVIQNHSSGDMVSISRFRHAFLLAQIGDTMAAKKAFDTVARMPGTTVWERDQALYWRARLKLYPQLAQLSPTKDLSLRNEGFEELLSLARARPASYYGHLAWRLAEHARDTKDVREETPKGTRQVPQSPLRTEALGWPPLTGIAQWDQAETFALGRALAQGGHQVEAIWIFERLLSDDLNPANRLALADAFARSGAFGQSHRVLRAGQAHWPDGMPTSKSLTPWALAFPLAYAKELGQASLRANLPKHLMNGLSREESAFEPDVNSWAGAIGLCQLMPYTAKEEAELAGLPTPNIQDLYDPQLNALLGSNHLARRLRGLHHPLLAIAAYNAGPGRVKRWRKGHPTGFPLDTFVEGIPVDQTRNYVKKVTGSWVTYAYLQGGVDSVIFSMLLP